MNASSADFGQEERRSELRRAAVSQYYYYYASRYCTTTAAALCSGSHAGRRGDDETTVAGGVVALMAGWPLVDGLIGMKEGGLCMGGRIGQLGCYCLPRSAQCLGTSIESSYVGATTTHSRL
ncbi:unnamed protein product [Calypogeia fissa]